MWASICRQSISAVLLLLSTLGCSGDGPPVGVVGHVRAYFGGVAADEPEAVLVGRDVLSAGGSATDAVVSMGLAMMVTRPDAAGPGGGGMCIVFDAATEKSEAIEFLPHAPTTPAPPGRWLAATPGGFRGLFALHARYGRLRWEQLILPAERMARFGIRIPRVVTRVLAGPAGATIQGNIGRSIFFDVAGRPRQEGDVLRQVDLATTLGRLRIVGPGDFYSGPLARSYVDGVRQAGGWMTIEDLRGYRPRWLKTRSGKFDVQEVYFLPSPAAGGEVAAEIWKNRSDKGFFAGLFAKESDPQKFAKFVSAARQGYDSVLAQPNYDTDTASAGALAIDRGGNAAACVLTMDRPFGSGRIAGETGIIPARPARAGSLLALSAMIVANPNIKQSLLAATGAGDQFASSAMMGSVLAILDGKATVESALNAARFAASAGKDDVLVESGLSSSVKKSLRAGAGKEREVPRLGLVNIMWCAEGIVEKPELCAVKTDPRGFGHAINAEFIK